MARRATLVQREHGWCLRANQWGELGLVRGYFAVVSRLGDGAFWYALMGLMVVGGGWEGLAASAHLAATGCAALFLYRRLKRWTKRPRPCNADARIRAWVAPLDEFSFPSGHTLHAVAFSLVAVAHDPALGWLLLPFTASIAASRVVLGVHYPSDVLAATVVGGLLAGLSLWAGAAVGLLP